MGATKLKTEQPGPTPRELFARREVAGGTYNAVAIRVKDATRVLLTDGDGKRAEACP